MPTQMTVKRRPIRSQAAGLVMNEETRGELKSIGDLVVATYFNELVRHWDSDLTFRVSVQVTANRVILSIIPQGSEEALLRWKMVNEGRPGGAIIAARNPSGVMRFMTGYVKKTGLAVGGPVEPGGRYGEWIAKPQVTQGAVEAGNYTEEAQEKYVEPILERRMRAAYRRAFRKVTGRSI